MQGARRDLQVLKAMYPTGGGEVVPKAKRLGILQVKNRIYGAARPARLFGET